MPARLQAYSAKRCQDLPAVVSLPQLAHVFGMGEKKARGLIHDGEFPVAVEMWGGAYVAFRSQILRRMGIRDIYADETTEQEAARLAADPAALRAAS